MNNNSSKQVLLSVIGVAILVVAVVGVSFAFFSFTNTGDANTVQTGTIVFEASSNKLTLANVFPTASAYTGDGQVATVKVSGNTTYEEGIEYRVTATNVTDGTNGLLDPTVEVTAGSSLPEGLTVENVFAGQKLTEGAVLATGKIAANKEVAETTILTIGLYYDMDEYHISDNTKDELVAAKLLPAGYTGKIIPTATWNALTDKTAYSFTINITAVEGGSANPRY